jgi:ribosomal protein S18 acetylase RimI-like enzyme
MKTIGEHTFRDTPSLTDEDFAVAGVYGQLFGIYHPDNDTAESMRTELADYGGRCYVLRDGESVLGVANYRPLPYSDDSSAKESYLQGIAIDKQLRGQGFGRIMIDYLLRKTREDGNEALTLHAQGDNAVKFYRALQFIITDPLDPDMTAMRKDVI